MESARMSPILSERLSILSGRLSPNTKYSSLPKIMGTEAFPGSVRAGALKNRARREVNR